MDIKTAVGKAKEIFQEFYPDKKETIRLEETEFNEKSLSWEITLSFVERTDVEIPSHNSLFTFPEIKDVLIKKVDSRVFKTLYLRDKDGGFIKMKIRTV